MAVDFVWCKYLCISKSHIYHTHANISYIWLLFLVTRSPTVVHRTAKVTGTPPYICTMQCDYREWQWKIPQKKTKVYGWFFRMVGPKPVHYMYIQLRMFKSEQIFLNFFILLMFCFLIIWVHLIWVCFIRFYQVVYLWLVPFIYIC